MYQEMTGATPVVRRVTLQESVQRGRHFILPFVDWDVVNDPKIQGYVDEIAREVVEDPLLDPDRQPIGVLGVDPVLGPVRQRGSIQEIEVEIGIGRDSFSRDERTDVSQAPQNVVPGLEYYPSGFANIVPQGSFAVSAPYAMPPTQPYQMPGAHPSFEQPGSSGSYRGVPPGNIPQPYPPQSLGYDYTPANGPASSTSAMPPNQYPYPLAYNGTQLSYMQSSPSAPYPQPYYYPGAPSSQPLISPTSEYSVGDYMLPSPSSSSSASSQQNSTYQPISMRYAPIRPSDGINVESHSPLGSSNNGTGVSSSDSGSFYPQNDPRVSLQPNTSALSSSSPSSSSSSYGKMYSQNPKISGPSNTLQNNPPS
ncbi:hypothetical protein DI09_46p190 [Mitosporidium daphniae]|uniref:Uncharacterized protein n=1 Tax=Mitosporidium daphniae TaxID=1485682 RepID=A0A098VQH7_9MICR|nr:uncharacterized protein DI09_46p190 [Mitosporidium daphniae]KGG51069.1 hypothetical protein DI09_46p190 [Mitosporidium daphniae]|eukprot:XP_013237496.1 uncharacterized protein DI09_46p190 [Mitosporidium daphniae]